MLEVVGVVNSAARITFAGQLSLSSVETMRLSGSGGVLTVAFDERQFGAGGITFADGWIATSS